MRKNDEWNPLWLGRIIMALLLALVSFLMISLYSCARSVPVYLQESDAILPGVEFCEEERDQTQWVCISKARWLEMTLVETQCREVLRRE